MNFNLNTQIPQLAIVVSVFFAAVAIPAFSGTRTADEYPPGWRTASPRDEIRPRFAFDPTGGPKSDGCFVITHDGREGLDGWFSKTFPVTGGKCYRFHAGRQVRNVSAPRRSAVV